MKIGLDIHGVISKYPEFFLRFAKMHLLWGNEIHIITGSPKENAIKKLESFGFSTDYYTKIFSIVDHHRRKGTKMWKNKNGSWEMDEKIWWNSKAIYWKTEKIDVHYDDSEKYNTGKTKILFILVK